MNEITGRFPVAADAAITPEILASTIKVVGLGGPFLIKGFASDVKPWPKEGAAKSVYGLLRLGESAVRFRSDPNCAPVEGEAVVMSATLAIKPAKVAGRDRWNGSFDVQLLAAKAGNWTPGQGDRRPVQISDRPNRVPLETFVESNGAGALTVLVSGNAEADVLQSLNRASVGEKPRVIRGHFDDEEKLISAARQAASSGCLGLALARGGGTGLELIANSVRVTKALIELGLPFYSAMGHGSDVFLLDKYADQCFHTPTELAATIARVELAVAQRLQSQEDGAALRRKNCSLTGKLEALEASEGDARQAIAVLEANFQTLERNLHKNVHAHRKGVSLSWSVIAGVIVAFLIVAWGAISSAL